MFIPIISAMRFDRNNHDGSGDDGGKLNSDKSNSGGGDRPKTSDVGNPPEGNNKATTNGEGGETSIEVDSGDFEESSDDDGTKSQVHGTG